MFKYWEENIAGMIKKDFKELLMISIRIIPLILVTPILLIVALTVIDRVDKIQQDKMHQLCQIDQSYCTLTNERLHSPQVQEPIP